MKVLKQPPTHMDATTRKSWRCCEVERMPKKFTEKHGKDLLERVILKVPNGDVWRVDLQKSGDEIWLKNGWWEFAEHYSLKYGHLLMFKYERFSIFGVVIFDTSATEIVYPPYEERSTRKLYKRGGKKQSTSHSTHLLVYPFSSSGHIIPLLDLTDSLLRRGLTITVVISPLNLQLLDPLLSSHPTSLHKLLSPDPEINLSSHPLISKVISTQKQFDPIVKWFRSHPSPPVAIISDFFLGWTSELASQLGIRRVVFNPSGVFGISIIQTMWRDAAENNDYNGVDKDNNSLVSFPEIPSSPEFQMWQLPTVSRNFKKGDPDYESVRKGMLSNMTSWGSVYNTFEDLEKTYMDHMKKQMGHDRVWAVGPLLPKDGTARGGASAAPPHELLTWLDNKPGESVVYICFGSRTTLNENQMSALTGALELSNVNFILCAKGSDSAFKERVGDRGFIVEGWAPQLAILRHRAVGSFVTHCGWNSTLEGISAGVMLLTWPMGADQYADEKLLVDELGVGKRACEGRPDNVPDSVELARLLDESMSGEILERVKVKELSQAAKKAVNGGSSIRDLDMFVKLICEL